MLQMLLLDAKNPKEVAEKLKQFEFTVEHVQERSGPYNLQAWVCTDNHRTLNHFIDEQLHPLQGINKIQRMEE